MTLVASAEDLEGCKTPGCNLPKGHEGKCQVEGKGSEMSTSTANISAAVVKDLRDKTDAPMMECKKALTEAKGDMDEAIKLLQGEAA